MPETDEKPKEKNRFILDDDDVDALEVIRKEDREDLDLEDQVQ